MALGLTGGFCCYEGGPSHHIGSTINLANRIRAERDPGMATELKYNFKDCFFDIGGNLAVLFCLSSGYNRYGCFGLTDNISNPDRNYKFQAVRELSGNPTIVYNFPYSGWYMVSVPGTAADADMSVASLFPDAVGGVAYFLENNGYVQKDTLQTGLGYWIFAWQQSTTIFEIVPIQQYQLHFDEPGWYMIGSVIRDVDFSQPDIDPPQSVIVPTWTYNGTIYVASDTIESQKGYWMAVCNSCDLTVDANSVFSVTSKSSEKNADFLLKMDLNPPCPPDLLQFNPLSQDQPLEFSLRQNYPNPFNPETTINYVLSESGAVTLEIYDIAGKKIATLVNDQENAGYYSMTWNGRGYSNRPAASGIYLCRLHVGEYHKTIRMLLLK